MPHRRPRKELLDREKFRYDTLYYVRYRVWNVTSIRMLFPFIPILPVPVPVPMRTGRHYPKKMEEIRGLNFLPSTNYVTLRHVP